MSTSRDIRKGKAVELATRHTPHGGRILEISCGAGNELLQLQQAGYEVVGTNYTQYEGETTQVEIRHGVDVLQGLPFEDASCDTVLLLDVIEHLANHDQAITELSRVCKPGGHIIIMTPNILKIASRIEFLFTGFFKLKRAFIGFDVPPESAFAFHNYPAHLPVLLYQLHAQGLSLKTFTASVYKMKSFAFYIACGPLIALATRLKLWFGERNLKGTPHAEDIRRCLTSVAGLCGEYIFLVAQKETRRDLASINASATALPEWARKWKDSE